MNTIIETNRASLDTVSVTIQTVRVGGKQMTISVFRQLPICESNNVDTNWGIIRHESRIWLLFERNHTLRRRILRTTVRAIDESLEQTIALCRNSINYADIEIDKQVKNLIHCPGWGQDHYHKKISELQKDRDRDVVRLAELESHYRDCLISADNDCHLLATLPQLFIAC